MYRYDMKGYILLLLAAIAALVLAFKFLSKEESKEGSWYSEG